MPSYNLLHEDGFDLEFRTENGLSANGLHEVTEDLFSSSPYIFQERMIIPPDLPECADRLGPGISRDRRNEPLIFVGKSGFPAQYGSMIVRANPEKAVIQKSDSTMVLRTEGVTALFSAPISAETSDGFSIAFQRISRLLRDHGMGESAIARTWLFMEDILRDYEGLNAARKEFFNPWYTPSNHFIPASTGIQGRNAKLWKLSVEFCAFSGERVSIRQLASPLQNEPTEYGKLFSRAVQVRFPKNDLIFISGTASIDKSGFSIYRGDFKGQLKFTLEVLAALLGSVGGDFSHVVQSMIYFKRGDDLENGLELLDRAGFPWTRALFQLDVDVCRDDLLCEIEATAVKPRCP